MRDKLRYLLLSSALRHPSQEVQTWLLAPQAEPGNLRGRHVVATDVAGKRSHLFFLQDPESGVRYLVDTGAEVSVLPPDSTDLASPPIGTLRAANDNPIRVFGRRSRTLNIGLRRQFRWIFLVAAM